MIIGAVNLVATFVSILIVDRAGRRVLFLEGGFQMMLAQVRALAFFVFPLYFLSFVCVDCAGRRVLVTPLNVAVGAGSTAAVRLLLQAGADLHLKCPSAAGSTSDWSRCGRGVRWVQRCACGSRCGVRPA